MTRLLDLEGDLSPVALDSIGLDKLERIVAAVARLRAHRQVDPELRASVLRHIDRATLEGRISEERGDAWRAELDEAVPGVVLEAHWRELLPPSLLARPALGCYRRGVKRA